MRENTTQIFLSLFSHLHRARDKPGSQRRSNPCVMDSFEEELARREAVRQHEAAIEALVKARQQLQIEFNAAMERHDKEFLETQRRRQEEFLEVQQCQDRIRRENAEQDAADAKAAALAQQQLWELFVKAVSKPTSVKASKIIVPLAPDRELAQVDNQIMSEMPMSGPQETSSESSGDTKSSGFQTDVSVRNVVHFQNDARIVRKPDFRGSGFQTFLQA